MSASLRARKLLAVLVTALGFALAAALGGGAPASAATIETIPTTPLLWKLAASPDGAHVYGVDYEARAVLEMDPVSRTVSRTFPLPAGNEHPMEIGVSPDGGTVYVLTETSLVALDAATGAVTRVFGPLRTENGDLAIAPDGATVYASSRYDGIIYTIDVTTGTIDAHPTSVKVVGFGVVPDGAKLYFGSWAGAGFKEYVGVLDLETGAVSQIPLPTPDVFGDLVVAPDGKRAYAATQYSGVIVIDTETDAVVAVTDVPDHPLIAAKVSADGRWVYAIGIDGTVYTISTATNRIVVKGSSGAGFGRGVAVAPNGSALYEAVVIPTQPETYGVSILPVPVLSGGALTGGVVGASYSAVVRPAGDGPFEFSASGLPDGLVIDPATGEISGVPSRTGDFTVAVSVSNGVLPAVGEYTIQVAAAPEPPALPGGTLPAGTAGSAYRAEIVPSAGTGPFSYAAAGLPAGLSIDPETGVISGTPTAPGDATVTVAVTNAAGSASAVYSVRIAAVAVAPEPPGVGPGVGSGAGPIAEAPGRPPAVARLAATGSTLPIVAAVVGGAVLLAGGAVLVIARVRRARTAPPKSSTD